MRIFTILAIFFAFCFGASLNELKSNCAYNAKMCADLGDYYYRNNKDFFSAKDYYEIACNAKNDYACYRLGYLYENGIGVRQDISKAFDFHNQACILGLQVSCEYVIKWGKEDCQNGFAEACFFIANYYIESDIQTAMDYFKQACILNHTISCDFVKKVENSYFELVDKSYGINAEQEQTKAEKQNQERQKQLEQERRERERLEAQREREEFIRLREQEKAEQTREQTSKNKTVSMIILLIGGFIFLVWVISSSSKSNENSQQQDNHNSNDQNSTYSNSNEGEHKGFFTTQEASYIVQILAKLIISDGEIDTKEVLTLGAFINFVANDDEKQAEILLDIFTKALTSNISPYKTVFFYKQKFNPNRAEMTYIIFLFLHMAYSDGEFSYHEKAIFDEIFKGFGISDDEKARIYDYFYKQYGHKYRSRSREKFDDDFDGEYDSDESYYSDEPDPYEVLGLSKDATFDEVKKRYRKLASQNHPDRFANASNEEIAAATKRMQEINTAYEKIKKEMGK